MSISVVSASDNDKCTVEEPYSDIYLVDSIQSTDNGFEEGYNQVSVDKNYIVSESGKDSDTYVNLSEENFPSIPNNYKSNISEMDYNERAQIAKAVADSLRSNKTKMEPIDHDKNISDIDLDLMKIKKTTRKVNVSDNSDASELKEMKEMMNKDFIINGTTVIPINESGTFLSKVKDKNLIALDFDPETGILKVNPNCPYMKSDYINSTELKWYVSVYNNDYLNESDRFRTSSWEIGDGYPTRYSKEFNITEYISKCYFPLWLTDGCFTCKITVDVLGAKDFSIDFLFPVKLDEFNNVKYCPLQKSVAHISGKTYKIYDNHNIDSSVFGINYNSAIISVLLSQLKANK